MGLTWGVHTGLSNTTVDELKDLWHRIEAHGFDWISIWDHFYAADLGAARYADRWNIPFVAPEVFAHKREVLAQHCAAVDREPSEIRCAVNVGAARDLDGLRAQFGGMTDYARPGCLVGSPDEMVDQIGAFVAAGADQINLAIRAPWDLGVLDELAEARARFDS